MKILMLGNHDSGKTTFMASAYGELKNGIAGFRLKADAEADNWLMTLYNGIHCGNYPTATSKRTSYSYELSFNGTVIQQFDWVDFYGGVITDTKTNELPSDVADADAVMLFFDAVSLVNDDEDKHQMQRVVSILMDRLPLITKQFSIIAVITKCDLLADAFGNGQAMYEAICKPFEPFLAACKGHGNLITRVVPVCSSTDYGLLNVDFPLLDIVDTNLQVRLKNYVEYREQHVKSAKERTRWTFWDFVPGVNIIKNIIDHNEINDDIISAKFWQEQAEAILEPIKKLSRLVEDYKYKIPIANTRAVQSNRSIYDAI